MGGSASQNFDKSNQDPLKLLNMAISSQQASQAAS